ncbi:hypothetical protein M5W70_05680 [Paenibacillus larvae]|uniref:Uncharacterized protein n=2 Tax=Paenibacillus larvae TaxID=1464 RepID=A0AAP5JSJ5_9BACL|nr:hypothetical protein [Paenibacillus larvae]MCY9688225.1 hypothetical protein [Paenibacillus larvae]MDT2251223.1 hypothetical protein [Paenibacillus larvae]
MYRISFAGGEARHRKAIVSTGGQNIPAKNLYVKYGFIETRQIPITEGIYLSVLEK